MMIKPGISELSRRVDSRYTLVTMASKRARMIVERGVDDPNQVIKPVSEAVSEIADGKVGYVRRTPIDQLNFTGPDFYTEKLSEEFVNPQVAVTEAAANEDAEIVEENNEEPEYIMPESVNMPARQ